MQIKFVRHQSRRHDHVQSGVVMQTNGIIGRSDAGSRVPPGGGGICVQTKFTTMLPKVYLLALFYSVQRGTRIGGNDRRIRMRQYVKRFVELLGKKLARRVCIVTAILKRGDL